MLGASSAFWRLNEWLHQEEDVLLEKASCDVGLVLFEGHTGPELVVYGEPGPAIAALEDVVARGIVPERTMINREVYGALDERLRNYFGPNWGHAWDFFWAKGPVAPVPYCELVEYVRAGSLEFHTYRADIRQALLASNPISDAVDQLDELDWFFLRAPDGQIATVMGAERVGDVIGFYGLGTVPDYRGHGYGGATMVGAVNASLDLAAAIRFGVWAWNEGAMRLYTRLGVRHDGALISGRNEPFEELGGA